MSVYLLLALVGIVAYIFLRKNGPLPAGQRHPPGPRGLPLVGNLFNLDIANIGECFCRWAGQYGPVFRLTLGKYNVVVLSDPQLIRETFSREEFLNRPQFQSVKWRSQINHGSHGVVFAEGDAWKEHRRFILQTFRDFGVGKLPVEERIEEEAARLVDQLHGTTEAIDTRDPISAAVANVIGAVLTGQRYEPTDPHFRRFLALNRLNFAYSWQRAFVALLPWTRRLPVLRDKYKQIVGMYEGLRDFLKRPRIRICNGGRKGKRRILSMGILRPPAAAITGFDAKEIPLLLEDLFEAGYDTTTTTLRWALLLVGLHTDMQKKIVQEMESKDLLSATPEALIHSGHVHALPYTEAFLLEVQRFATIAPLGVPHTASTDTTIAGYYVPKGSWIVACLRAVHHSEKYWPNPEEFDPQRFLTGDGQLAKLPDTFVPFSLGKRRCLGETLAKSELYIFFLSILRVFLVLAEPAPDASGIDLRPLPGLTADTRPHRIRFIPLPRLPPSSP
ncbi:LOW QUALITY PROTEIN: cytochrome P450 2K1-like [Paramacrobiotus metropolitanus]|uniref:LOW QUALITY PROTEIN: cytochrome P450 2K1-like n=1 Tax=Paramacrobiotus metropolitanus TaxID=2943436 RepID=UPI002446278D|nr:LOW QUALITY PROTEIN: cytochrome P450 2K1-like [Paramacrobiotus metropolitanus]